MTDHAPRLPAIVVLISGRGSNLGALISAVATGTVPARIAAVISNVADAPGLEKARAADIEAETVDQRDHAGRAAFDAALGARIDAHAPQLIVLAGFMRILGAELVSRHAGRMINIHPSLLPAFPGLDTHARALAAGATEHGASVHFVTEELDGGPVIAQARVAVHPNDDVEQLAARVLTREHPLLVTCVRLIITGRVALHAGRATLDGDPIAAPLRFDD